MGQKLGRDIKTFIPPFGNSMAEMDGVPVYDDRREQVQSGDPVMLPLGGSIPDFTLPANAQRILELLPATMVAAHRNRSGQFATISSSRILPPTRPRKSLGVAAGLNT